MTKVAVVILNYNGKKFLEEFIPNILANTPKDIAELIVADNNSTDDSVSFMREQYPNIRLIINDKNGGFSTGYNQALRQIEAEYFVLLNSDIEVTPNWIEPIIKLMDSDKSIATCQPKLLSYYERNKFEYAGAGGGFIDKYGYPFCRGRLFQELETDNGQYDDTIEVFWATGACMFVRAEYYLNNGGLDDSFFAHMEEIDFCWRMKNLGYKNMYCPESYVYHIGGGTLPKQSSRKTFLNFRNNLSLLMKNLPKGHVFFTIAYRILLDWVAAFKFLADGNKDDFTAVLKAHIEFYKRIPQLRKVRRNTTHSKVSCVYGKNIVFEHYLKKKKLFTELNKQAFSK